MTRTTIHPVNGDTMAATVTLTWSTSERKYPESHYAHVLDGHLHVLTGNPAIVDAALVAVHAPGSWRSFEIDPAE